VKARGAPLPTSCEAALLWSASSLSWTAGAGSAARTDAISFACLSAISDVDWGVVCILRSFRTRSGVRVKRTSGDMENDCSQTSPRGAPLGPLSRKARSTTISRERERSSAIFGRDSPCLNPRSESSMDTLSISRRGSKEEAWCAPAAGACADLTDGSFSPWPSNSGCLSSSRLREP
jgi:hypothetical protein